MFIVPHRQERKVDARVLPEWNSHGYPAWHPVILWDLFIGVMIAPDWLHTLLSDEHTRYQVGSVGKWLCLALMSFLSITLGIALDGKPANWTQLVDVRGVAGLFLWSLSLGAVGAIAVISEQPALFFFAAMLGFFVGLLAGLLAFLIVEIWLRQCYHWRRPWLGRLNLAILIVTQFAGLWMISGYAF